MLALNSDSLTPNLPLSGFARPWWSMKVCIVNRLLDDFKNQVSRWHLKHHDVKNTPIICLDNCKESVWGKKKTIDGVSV